MNKILIASALFSTLAICSGAASAHAYHAEIEATTGFDHADHGDSGNEFGVHGTYFFKRVDIKGVPLAETAFMDRASSISAHAHFADHGETNDDTYGAEFKYYAAQTHLYASGGISQSKEKWRENDRKYDLNTTYYDAEVGILPVQGLLITAGVKGYENDHENGVSPTLGVKYLTKIAGKHVNFEAETSFGDLQEFNVATDLYINDTWSIGADFEHNDVEDISEVGLKTRKFLNAQFSLEGRVGFGEEHQNQYTTFDLAARYHF